MALSRIPLPSFTLVLTSGPQSFHRYPTAIKFDPSTALTMRPTAPDYLMRTIDLRGEPDDGIQIPLNKLVTLDYGRIYLETILEEEELSTYPAVGKQSARSTSTKQYVLMLLQSLRQNLFSVKNTDAGSHLATTI